MSSLRDNVQKLLDTWEEDLKTYDVSDDLQHSAYVGLLLAQQELQATLDISDE